MMIDTIFNPNSEVQSPKSIIGFDATALETPQRSGVGNYAAQLLAALMARNDGRHYALLASRPLNGHAPLGAAGQIGRTLSNRSAWMQLVAPRIIDQLQPDVCHFTNSIAPLRSSRPIVITLHDMSLFLHANMHPLKSLLVARPIIPLAVRRASAIITVSQHAKEDIVNVLGIDRAKVHVVYEAAAPQYRVIDERAELDRVQNKYHLDRPFVLYVGTIEPRKNLTRLVQAFARIRRPSTQLVLVGQLGWKYRSLLKQIEDMRLGDAIRLIGYVPDEDLPALYNLARVFAFPSIYEGFGLPIVEAMACGTPVLTSNRSSMIELGADAALLVDPLDVESLAVSLAHVLDDTNLRAELHRKGLQRAAQFSWTRAAEETVKVYETVEASECHCSFQRRGGAGKAFELSQPR
jgi:glycosyltransferase involved in cell wall biosynthesis